MRQRIFQRKRLGKLTEALDLQSLLLLRRKRGPQNGQLIDMRLSCGKEEIIQRRHGICAQYSLCVAAGQTSVGGCKDIEGIGRASLLG